MRYGQIRKFDVANGEGIRTSIFVTGCSHGCKGCFNTAYQSKDSGTEWTDDTTKQVIEWLRLPEVTGLSLLGGEPFDNTTGLLQVVKAVREDTVASDKGIWVWSGYTFEQILESPDKLDLLEYCDVLIDGRFVEELKDLRLKFRGSRNQRLINVSESLKKGIAIPFEV